MRRQLDLIFALAWKDWQLFFADRRSAMLAFAVPVVLASAFGLVFHRPADASEPPRLPILVVVDAEGPFTTALVKDLLVSPRLEATVATRDEAESRIADRRPGVALILTADLERLATWKPGQAEPRPRIPIHHNPLCASEAHWAEGVVSEVIMKRFARERLSPFLPDAHAATTLPFEVQTQATTNSHAGFNSYTHSFNGMTLQYLLFWGMESGLLLLRERQRSLWHRVRAAPVPLSCLLIAKLFSTALIALLMVSVTFAFGYFAFGVKVAGSWIGFALLAMGVSALAAATGLLVAAIGGTEARARSVSILVILGVSMLGGLWLPSFVMPGWARDLSLTVPTSWAMRGFDSVTWQGQGFLTALPSVLAVMAFTGVFLAVAVARLVHSEARQRRGIL